MSRYDGLELPYHVSGFIAGFAVDRLKFGGVWDELPKSLRSKLESAGWDGVSITRADLDQLSDDTWDRARAALGV